jgi:putative addiction module killer protein
MCNIPYSNKKPIRVFKTFEFISWLDGQPPKTITIITARIEMISIGHFGDHKKFDGLIEFRWKNGIRVYAFLKEKYLIVILIGGNKNGQSFDIKKAKKIKGKIE